MSEGPGFLEFFILEASDYVEQLDGLLLGGSSNGPDADAMQRVARALRGTATMAKLSSFADVAAGVERVGRAMQDGVLHWDPALGGALVAAVDDLKTLLHSARRWSPAEDQRAASRTAELARFAPPLPFAPPRDSGQRAAVAGSAFLAAEASNIAAGIELLTTRGGASDTAANVLRRVRALRGVAGVKEVAPLADVLEATEDTARGLELGESALTSEARQLLDASAEYLRVLSSALRFEGDVSSPSPARDLFLAAQDRWVNRAGQREQIVPISTLFYVDGGPGVVETTENPPTSAAARFRLELVSHGEHLRQVIDAVRRNSDPASADRVKRDLHRALRAVETTIESFGERSVADALRVNIAGTNTNDSGLRALDELASILSSPGEHNDRLAARLRDVAPRKTGTPSEPPVRAPEPAATTGALQAASVEEVQHQPATPTRTPTHATPMEVIAQAADDLTSAATALLDSGLAALEELTSEPWLPPVAIPEEAVVPIESLLYRGRAALDRAAEIRDQVRRSGSHIDKAELDELFDLVELARAE